MSLCGRILQGHSRSRVFWIVQISLFCMHQSYLHLLPHFVSFSLHKNGFWDTWIKMYSSMVLLLLPDIPDSSFISQDLFPKLFLVQQEETVFCIMLHYTKGASLQQRRCGSIYMTTVVIYWSYHIPCYPEDTRLIEKVAIEAPAWWWHPVRRKCQFLGHIEDPNRKYHGSGNQEVKLGGTHLLSISLRDSFKKFVLPITQILALKD